MTDERFLSMLGLCMKAGRLSVGHDAAKESIRSRKSFLCILTADASARLIKEMQRLSEEIPLIVTEHSMDDMKRAIGKRAGVLSINDESFAGKLLDLRNKEA